MLEKIIAWDHYLFKKLNGEYTFEFLDQLMPLVSEPEFWIPLYLFILLFVVLNYPQGKIKILLAIILTVVITDQLTSSIIKPYFGRLRPCHVPDSFESLRLLVKCGSGKSFVSGHSANHFAQAFCWIALFGKRFRWIIPVLIFWAMMVAYSRVYIGVHFPVDILVGGILGALLGYAIGSLGLWLVNKLRVEHEG